MPEKQPEPKEGLDLASQSLIEALNLSFKILKIIMVVLVLLFLSSGIFTVEQNEEAMVLRFGKIQGSAMDRVLKPGLHWTWPYPFSEVIKIPAGSEHNLAIQEFWYEETEGKKTPETLSPQRDGYCITADANIIHAQWQVRYLITDPYLYHNRIQEPEKLLQNILCQCIVEATAGFTAADALKNKMDVLRNCVKEKAQSHLDRLKCGIEIQGLVISQVAAPRQVQDAFQDVIRAKNERDKKVEAAKNYQAQVLNKAQGDKAEILAKAQNYALQVTKEAQSDGAYFTEIARLYAENPEILSTTHHQQLMERLTEQIRELFLLGNDVPHRELRINLSRNPDLQTIQAPKEE